MCGPGESRGTIFCCSSSSASAPSDVIKIKQEKTKKPKKRAKTDAILNTVANDVTKGVASRKEVRACHSMSSSDEGKFLENIFVSKLKWSSLPGSQTSKVHYATDLSSS